MRVYRKAPEAVWKDARGQGAGSLMLKTLLNAYHEKGFFVEVESIYDKNAKNLPERMKRRAFYTKKWSSRAPCRR